MPATLSQYPPEKLHLQWGLAGSLTFHLFLALLVLTLTWLTGVKSIEELMKESGSLALAPPPPDPSMEVELKDLLPPPPPVTNPEFIRQIEKPQPQPELIKQQPRITPPAPSAPSVVSKLVVGSGSFPRPGYPYQALLRHESGTATVSIQFDSEGNASEVEVIDSSGYGDLDSNTRSFVRSHWHDPSFAGRSATVPIEYRL